MEEGWESLDEESRKRFEKRGRNPQSWQETALDLHRAAGLLWDRVELGSEPFERTDWMLAVSKVAMMLEGFAIELLAKAALVHHDPELVSGGQWRGPSRGHPLPSLLRDIGINLGQADEQDLVARLAAFVLWAGRYPIPKDYREWTATLKGNTLQLAPGTYYSTSDRQNIERLITRLQETTR